MEQWDRPGIPPEVAARRHFVFRTGRGPLSSPGVPGSAPTPDYPGAAGGILVPPFPETQAPPGSQFFAAQGVLPGVDAAAGTVELGVYQVPDSSVAVVRMLQFTAVPWTATSQVEFRLLLDGVPVAGWSPIAPPLLPATAVVLEFPPELVTVRVDAGQRIAVVAQVLPADPGVYQLQGMARGWQYGIELADRFAGAWG